MLNHNLIFRGPAYFACALTLLNLLVANSASATEPDWRAYDALLKVYVSPGTTAGVNLNQVDYHGLARDPKFNEALRDLEAFDLDTLEPGEETVAFYINAYNLLTLRMVVDHLPLDSIRDVGNFFRPVWKRHAGTLGGARVSLDDIEHDRLRKLGEPRMHFAIVCASVSCPDLRTEAYRAGKLEMQLDDQTAGFLDNSGKGLRIAGARVSLSKIFKWFAGDFASAGGALAFVQRYRPLPERVTLDSPLAYNWSLNGR